MAYPGSTTNMADTTALDANLILAWKKAFFISAEGGLTRGLDSLVTDRTNEMMKTMSTTEYTKLTVQTSALTEDTNPNPEEPSDSAHVVTPAEFGNYTQRTRLVHLQTAGQVDMAMVDLAVDNMKESREKNLILKGEASTNEITTHASGEASIDTTDVITPTFVSRMYNKLERSGMPRINGFYWAWCHPDVMHDLKINTDAAGWIQTNQYDNSLEVRNYEVGIYKGFRWISHPQMTINTDAGTGTVDTYHTVFHGANAFQYATSQETALSIRDANDPFGRFLNIGWYGVYNYAILNQDSLWMLTSASSIGTNT